MRRYAQEPCLQLQNRAVEEKWVFILTNWYYLLALLNTNYLLPDPIRNI